MLFVKHQWIRSYLGESLVRRLVLQSERSNVMVSICGVGYEGSLPATRPDPTPYLRLR
jgi:hypothetical protein